MDGSNGNSFNNLLPPGVSFCPTDEDLVLHFLHHKANNSDHDLSNSIIPQLQLHLYNPWQLHGKALSNNGEIHYFFSRVEEMSRATECGGYWKDLLMDEPILCNATGEQLGIKKFHVFFFGQQFQLEHDDEYSPTTTPIQTNWVMQQYLIYTYQLFNTDQTNQPQTKSEFGVWSLCRVFETKDNSRRSIFSYEEDEDNESELSYLDEMYLTFDDI